MIDNFSVGPVTPTAAQIATGIWQDATAGDFAVSGSVGKSLYTSGAAPGAANGLLIAGVNAATNFTSTVSGKAGLTCTGYLGGAGLSLAGGSTSGHGLLLQGGGSGWGANITGGATGGGMGISASSGSQPALMLAAVSGPGVWIYTSTGGDGVSIQPTGGHGITAAGDGTSKYGLSLAGGTAGTSDAVHLAAGTGGVGLNAGNISGVLATVTAYTGNTPQTGDSFARLGSPAGASIAADVATRLAASAYSAAPTAAAIDTQLSGTHGTGAWGGGGSAYTPAQIATAVWTDPTSSSDFSAAGSVGLRIATDLDAAVSTRSTYAGGDTGGTTTLVGLLTPTVVGRLDDAVSSRLAASAYSARRRPRRSMPSSRARTAQALGAEAAGPTRRARRSCSGGSRGGRARVRPDPAGDDGPARGAGDRPRGGGDLGAGGLAHAGGRLGDGLG